MLTVEQANSMPGCLLTPREHQIKVHLHNIFQKVRVRNRTALIARFYHRSSVNGGALDLVGAQVIDPEEPIKAVHFAA